MEKVIAVMGNVAAAKPDVLDNLDEDEFIREYGELVSAKPKIFKSREAVARIRAAKAKATQAQQAMQATMAGVQGAQTLSQTPISSDNALGKLLGVGPTAGNA